MKHETRQLAQFAKGRNPRPSCPLGKRHILVNGKCDCGYVRRLKIAIKTNAEINPIYAEVFPKGWLGERLHNVSNPRRHRWNIYLRACKRIPKSSPVHGCTDWKKINHRRHALIERFINEDIPKDAEYLALQEIAGVAFCGSTVVQSFLLARILRRLKQPSPDR